MQRVCPGCNETLESEFDNTSYTVYMCDNYMYCNGCGSLMRIVDHMNIDDEYTTTLETLKYNSDYQVVTCGEYIESEDIDLDIDDFEQERPILVWRKPCYIYSMELSRLIPWLNSYAAGPSYACDKCDKEIELYLN